MGLKDLAGKAAEAFEDKKDVIKGKVTEAADKVVDEKLGETEAANKIKDAVDSGVDSAADVIDKKLRQQ